MSWIIFTHNRKQYRDNQGVLKIQVTFIQEKKLIKRFKYEFLSNSTKLQKQNIQVKHSNSVSIIRPYSGKSFAD